MSVSGFADFKVAQNEENPVEDNLVGKICDYITYPCNDQSDIGNYIAYATITICEKGMVWTRAITL